MRDHGIQNRPDIIIHILFEQAGFESRKEGNFVVIELKLRSNRMQARADYNNLSRMCNILNYPLAVFININSNNTFFEYQDLEGEKRIHAFAVQLINGQVSLV